MYRRKHFKEYGSTEKGNIDQDKVNGDYIYIDFLENREEKNKKRNRSEIYITYHFNFQMQSF